MTDVVWGACTHAGHLRTVNEDTFVATPPVFAVADGMGGHERGEVASGLVAEHLRELADHPSLDPEVVAEAIQTVHRSIHSRSHAVSGREMGTTLAAIVLLDDPASPKWLMVNVGDSRVYRFASGELVQLSVDHSVVQELVDAGELTVDGARRHPDRNVITRAVGIGGELVADFALSEPTAGERILLCSDGVHGQLSVERISETLVAHPEPQEAAQALIGAVLEGAAPDNLTAVVVDVVVEVAPGALPDSVGGSTNPRPDHAPAIDRSAGPADPPAAGGPDPVVDEFIRVPQW